MGRNQQVRNHVSDSVEYGIDNLHRVAKQFLVYPLAAVEGAIQGAARGVHNVTTHKQLLDRADGTSHYGKYKNNKPHGSASGLHAGPSPYEFYSYTPASAHLAPPPAPAGQPQFQYQYQYHPTFPVPCRPPY